MQIAATGTTLPPQISFSTAGAVCIFARHCWWDDASNTPNLYFRRMSIVVDMLIPTEGRRFHNRRRSLDLTEGWTNTSFLVMTGIDVIGGDVVYLSPPPVIRAMCCGNDITSQLHTQSAITKMRCARVTPRSYKGNFITEKWCDSLWPRSYKPNVVTEVWCVANDASRPFNQML